MISISHIAAAQLLPHEKLAGVPLEDILRVNGNPLIVLPLYDREIERMDFTTTQPFADSILNALPPTD